MLGRLKQYFSDKNKEKHFMDQLRSFRNSEANSKKRFPISDDDLFPCLNDATGETEFDRHYVFHVAWAVRKVKEINPQVHVDFSSSLHFCTTLSAFIPCKFYDYRPAELNLSGLESLRGDLTAIGLPDKSISSLSCMHTIEHVGLGRYGDPIDYNGDLKAIEQLKRIVADKGNLLIVVPIGKPRLQFNAHRIYSYDQILEYFNGFDLKEFSLIPDSANDGGLVENATKELADRQKYGCGCFWFVRK